MCRSLAAQPQVEGSLGGAAPQKCNESGSEASKMQIDLGRFRHSRKSEFPIQELRVKIQSPNIPMVQFGTEDFYNSQS